MLPPFFDPSPGLPEAGEERLCVPACGRSSPKVCMHFHRRRAGQAAEPSHPALHLGAGARRFDNSGHVSSASVVHGEFCLGYKSGTPRPRSELPSASGQGDPHGRHRGRGAGGGRAAASQLERKAGRRTRGTGRVGRSMWRATLLRSSAILCAWRPCRARVGKACSDRKA